jgi:aspartate/methionine/tyrosine aminotransferase
MRLKPFLLDEWLDAHEHNAIYNLAASTGPVWTLNELLNLATEQERRQFLQQKVVYSRPAGADSLRAAIAERHSVPTESVQVVTGASEALLALFWLAAEPGANVIIPRPGFTTFSALPESLHLEPRHYNIRRQNNFRIDIEEIQKLADHNTKLILINSPHNPTGATISDAELDALHDFSSSRNIRLVVDEVYHPIFHGASTQSASRLPNATVIHDFSKAFPLSGIRTGWIIDHNAQRRKDYWTARAYFSITNNTPGEFLAELAMRHRDVVLGKTQKVATENLRQLDTFMARQRETIGWVRPQGGMTAFPWLVSGEDSREFCKAAAAKGIILAPGDCFDAPAHFRLGFAALPPEKFTEALSQLSELVKTWASVNLLKA